MAELIDRAEQLTRKEAIKALNEYGTLFPSDKSEAIDMAIMAIEALQIDIVRCGECKHRDPENKHCDCGALERQGCKFPVSDEYSCLYGERK